MSAIRTHKRSFTQQKIVNITDPDVTTCCCPENNQSLWNAHPKIFFQIKKEGKATCPYCSTIFMYKPKKSKD
jgi:uncharacterized Zn-finger protein